MFPRLIFSTTLLFSLAVCANNETGIADELVLKYGKIIKTGGQYSKSIRTLEGQGFACKDNRIAYDQVVVCRTSMSDRDISQRLSRDNITDLPNHPDWDVRIVIDVEGELITNFNVYISH